MIIGWAANDFGDDLGDGVAGPIGLLIIVLLVIATVLLMRSMNKHLKRVPEKWPDDVSRTSARDTDRSGSDASSSATATTDAADRVDRDGGSRAGDVGSVDAER